MRRKNKAFGRDPGLQARMLLTLFLLGLVYAVLIGVLFAAGAGAVTIAVVAGALFLVQYFTSDKIALYSMGVRQVSPQEAPDFHALIERLCIQADLPKPRVGIADTPMPNAFALGRSPRTATVCATTGLLDLLSPAELEAVMGHELTHVANRDVMVMTSPASSRRSHRSSSRWASGSAACSTAMTATTGPARSWSSSSRPSSTRSRSC